MYQAFFFGISSVIFVLGQMGLHQSLFDKNKGVFCISLASAVVWISVVANILAVAGFYDLTKTSGIILGIGLFLCLFYKKTLRETLRINDWKELLILMICFIALFLLYRMITIIPFGIGRDPSVYFYEAIHIAETGSIRFASDPFVQNNYSELKNLIDVNGAGLYSASQYGLSQNPSDIIIQFLHMFPCLLAVGYSTAGIAGLLTVNPILAILSAAIGFIFMKDVIGKKSAAWIALILCALNPAQIYCARITYSEMICQLIFLMSVYYFGQGWRLKSTYLIALSAIFAGLTSFNRIDMYILGIGIFVFAIYLIWIHPEDMRIAILYSISYLIAGALALWYGFTYSYPYLKDHWDSGVLSAIVFCNIALASLMLISLFLRKTIFKKVTPVNIVHLFSRNQRALSFLMAGLLIIALYAYFIRPNLIPLSANDDIRFQANALVEFCFYTSLAAIPLTIYGIYKLIRKVPEKKILSYLPWAFMAMINLFIYIYSPTIASDHIWASRRWVTICIPFVLMLTAVGISELSTGKITKYATVFMPVILVAFFLYQSRGFLVTNIGGDILEEYREYSNVIKDELYFSENKLLVTLLREVFGKKNVYRCNKAFADNIEVYLQNHETVYYIGDVPGSIKSNAKLNVQKVVDYSLYSNELERAKGRIAVNIEDVIIKADIYQLDYIQSSE